MSVRGSLWMTVLLAEVLLTACESRSPAATEAHASLQPTETPSVPTLATAEPAAVPSLAPRGEPLLGVERALRCGECHEKMYEEWSTSPHAASADSDLYKAMVKASGSNECVTCHEPLSGRIDDLRTVSEGVTCEVCHRIRELPTALSGSDFELDPHESIKYGPRCDPDEPYFHQAECRPFFSKAEVCASCHQWHFKGPSGVSIPVYTDYEDWKAGPYSRRGVACQDCHMPGERAPLATGERERDDVPEHSFLGPEKNLRGTGVNAVATVVPGEDELKVVVRLSNDKAGHPLPLGAPGRQWVLSAVAVSADGNVVDRAGATYERRLVDAEQRPAPFFLATRSDADTRLKPKQARVETFRLSNGEATTLKLELAEHALSPELGRRLEIQPPKPQVILSAEVPLSDSEGKRLRRTARVQLEP